VVENAKSGYYTFPDSNEKIIKCTTSSCVEEAYIGRYIFFLKNLFNFNYDCIYIYSYGTWITLIFNYDNFLWLEVK